mmetsp:Transcript_30089/g.47869  ORF Transcript_30089/g.47869 Transcript_30089/m.47869 type:complete len:127 (-) Transcript_30089:266-646(-)
MCLWNIVLNSWYKTIATYADTLGRALLPSCHFLPPQEPFPTLIQKEYTRNLSCTRFKPKLFKKLVRVRAKSRIFPSIIYIASTRSEGVRLASKHFIFWVEITGNGKEIEEIAREIAREIAIQSTDS